MLLNVLLHVLESNFHHLDKGQGIELSGKAQQHAKNRVVEFTGCEFLSARVLPSFDRRLCGLGPLQGDGAVQSLDRRSEAMRRHLLWALVLGLAAAGRAPAQENTTGSLAGQVVDAQGAA